MRYGVVGHPQCRYVRAQPTAQEYICAWHAVPVANSSSMFRLIASGTTPSVLVPSGLGAVSLSKAKAGVCITETSSWWYGDDILT